MAFLAWLCTLSARAFIDSIVHRLDFIFFIEYIISPAHAPQLTILLFCGREHARSKCVYTLLIDAQRRQDMRHYCIICLHTSLHSIYVFYSICTLYGKAWLNASPPAILVAQIDRGPDFVRSDESLCPSNLSFSSH